MTYIKPTTSLNALPPQSTTAGAQTNDTGNALSESDYSIAIRPAIFPDDTPLVNALFREYESHLQENDPTGSDAQFQDFDAELRALHHYTPPAGMLFLAYLDEALVGCIGWMRKDDRTCEGKRLYVRPSGRGRGIGKALFLRMIESAREMGFARMLGDTLPYMKAGLAMYETLGFKIVPPYFDAPLPDTIFMELDLTRPIGK